MNWTTTLALTLATISTSAFSATYLHVEHNGQHIYVQKVEDKLYPIQGDLFGQHTVSNQALAPNQVTPLLPTTPEKVFAVGMNFASHLASRSDAPPPMFLKLPSSLASTGQTLEMPSDARNVHFEGELVLVIGKTARNLSIEQASSAIFGVTAGNDLTERSWQGSDLQWMRAKAADGFGPVASEIVTDIDYNNVLLTTRLNGEVVQQENTRNMIHSPAKVVSYLSQYFTLKPGDLIFMGTPGRTRALSDGDQVSVTIDSVGSVVNEIAF